MRLTAVAPLRKALVGGLLLPALVLGSASLAAASCAPPLPLMEAVATSDLVLVGTVTAARSNNRVVTVAVEDIWRGDADPQIDVAGGPEASSGITSVDRTYVVGQRYLFFIREPAVHGSPGTFGARYEDNECTDTRPYTPDLDSLRPASARSTTAASTSSTSSTAPASMASRPDDGNHAVLVLSLGALVVGGTLTVLVWRVRHRPGRTVQRAGRAAER